MSLLYAVSIPFFAWMLACLVQPPSKAYPSVAVIIALVLHIWRFPIQKICQHLELCVRNCIFQLPQLLTEANLDS